MNKLNDSAIGRACAILGGQTVLANKLGIAAPTVNQWVSGVRPVPALKCPKIEALTNGQVTRKELRPNDWSDIWPELIEDKHE